MIEISALDGVEVRMQNMDPVRLFAPKWWRVDRHLTWFLTPKKRRASVMIRFLDHGFSGDRIVQRDVRAIAK